MPIIRANVARETAVMTDEASWYKSLNKDGAFASHETVNHAKDEYVRGHVTTSRWAAGMSSVPTAPLWALRGGG